MARYPFSKKEIAYLKDSRRYLIMVVLYEPKRHSHLYDYGVYPKVKSILKRYHFNIIEAVGADEALKKLKQLAVHQICPDALIVDGENFQYVPPIRKIRAGGFPYANIIPIVVAFLYTDLVASAKVFTEGADSFLEIPPSYFDKNPPSYFDAIGKRYVQQIIVGWSRHFCKLGRLRKKELARKK